MSENLAQTKMLDEKVCQPLPHSCSHSVCEFWIAVSNVLVHLFYHRLFAREDSNHQVCITGLTQQRVHNVEELMEVFIYVGRCSEGEKSQWIVPLTNQPSITSSQNCMAESIFLQVVVISSYEMLKGIVTRMFLVDFAKL